ncbi:uncharacterized protein LY89DRAFT_761301, partial [Mollisia scopiformis]
VDLIRCRATSRRTHRFCVEHISIDKAGQVLYLKDPCYAHHRCKHITINADGEIDRNQLPYRESITFLEPRDEEPTPIRGTSENSISLLGRCFGRCLTRTHTSVKNFNSNSTDVYCARASHFRISLTTSMLEYSDSGSNTDTANGEPGSNEEHTESGQPEASSSDHEQEKTSSKTTGTPENDEKAGCPWWVKYLYGVNSLPCAHCRQVASNPIKTGEGIASLIIYSSQAHGSPVGVRIREPR